MAISKLKNAKPIITNMITPIREKPIFFGNAQSGRSTKYAIPQPNPKAKA